MFQKNTLKLFLLVGFSLVTFLVVFSNASKGSPNTVPADISRQVTQAYKTTSESTAFKANPCSDLEQGAVKRDKDKITTPSSLQFHLPATGGHMMKLLPMRMRG